MSQDLIIDLPFSAPILPEPKLSRFQILRLGVVGVWQYDYEEWWPEDGWLLLTGRNGAGKSKVIELTLPFLFDAQMKPERTDPFGNHRSRSMLWNLLEEGEHKSRTGYTWIEFGKLEGGVESFLTVGAWLHATAAMPSAEAAYFVTSQRVGADLALPRPGQPVVGREQLRDLIGERGELFGRGQVREYQGEVNRGLFGMPVERYRDWVDLLIRLRRPKLSDGLRPSVLSQLLSESLPEIESDLVMRMASDYDQLDGFREKLSELASASRSVEDYLGDHRAYLKKVVRLAGQALRAANTKVDDAARELAAAGAERSEAEQRITEITARRDQLRAESEDAGGRLKALQSSPAIEFATKIQTASELAEAARETRDRELERRQSLLTSLEAAEAKVAVAQAEATDDQAKYERSAAQAARLASSAGLLAGHEGDLAELADQPEELGTRLRARATRRRGEVAEVTQGEVEVAGLRKQLGGREGEVQDREAATDQAAVREREAAAAVEQAELELGGRYSLWAAGLRELRLGEEVEVAVLDRLLTAPRAEAAGIVAERAETLRGPLHAELADRDREARELRSRAQALRVEREQVTAVQDLPPDAPVWREGRSRPGAPLWRLVDFAPEVADADAAALEAALEAAGLLDAWVTPDGLLSSGSRDAFLVAGSGPVSGRSLASVLVPVGSEEVPTHVVAAVLTAVALGEQSATSVWEDGRFSLGLLQGRSAKAQSEYIGATARERRRQTEIARLLGEEQDATARAIEVEAAAVRLRKRLEALRAESASLPESSRLAAAQRTASEAAVALRHQQAELDSSRARRDTAAEEVRRGYAELLRRATELDLAAPLERGELAALAGAVEAYRESCVEFGFAAQAVYWSGRRMQEAGADRGQLREQLGSCETLLAARVSDLNRREAVLSELRDSPEGRDAAETQARLAEVEGRIRALLAEDQLQQEAVLEQKEKVGAAGARLEAIFDRHQSAQVERQAAADGVVALARGGAVALAVEQQVDASGEWSMTRALELARQQLEPALAGADTSPDAVDRSRNRLSAAFQGLVAEIPAYQPWQAWAGDLPQVRATYNGSEVDLSDLARLVGEEREKTGRLLEEGEAQVIERYLLGDIAAHINERIQQGQERIDAINRLLRAHPTPSGISISVRWPLSPDLAEQAPAVRLLQHDPALLDDPSRDLLRSFLQERIRSAREQQDNRTWQAHLLEALDYRKWNRVELWRHQGEGRDQRLSDRVFGAGSGGEQAVMLHLPLFAIAATYYDSAAADSPRPVMLDEAFFGIDHEMRGSCMRVARDFGLDLVMTSYEETGCHPEVPALAIYHLTRQEGVRGVYSERWVWNGSELKRSSAGSA
ncbi:MAG TPA: TIGR02680 family protein [Candidatus Dormibacteraeota bacterium]|nr:TIGR02680 family protein [Candidatus Dormibacteraeota bacterium]